MTKAIKLGTLGLIGVLFAGCTVQPGEYRVYRIAMLPETLDANCYAGGNDPNLSEDTTTFFNVSTFAIFASDSDTYFLEFGSDALTGTRDKNDYSFAGDSTDIQILSPDPLVKSTTRVIANIEISLEGDEAFGTYVRTVAQGCSDGSEPGDNCESFGDNTECTVNGTFFGTWVKDAELEYPVGGNGGGGVAP